MRHLLLVCLYILALGSLQTVRGDELWILRWEFTNRPIPDSKGSGVEPDETYNKTSPPPSFAPCYLFVAYAGKASDTKHIPTNTIPIQYELVRGTICDSAGTGLFCHLIGPTDPITIVQRHDIGSLNEIAGSFAANPKQGWRDVTQDWQDNTLGRVIGVQIRRLDTNELITTSDGKSLLSLPLQ